MSRKPKLSLLQKATLKLNQQFQRRLSNLKDSTRAAIEKERALKTARLASDHRYIAERTRIIRNTRKGPSRNAALADLKRRYTGPYDRRIAALQNRQTTYAAAIQQDRKVARVALKKGYAKQRRAHKLIVQRTGVKIPFKSKRPGKLARSGGFEPSTGTVKTRIKRAKKSGRISFTNIFPCTPKGYGAYRARMIEASRNKEIQSWHYSLMSAGASKAMDFSLPINERSQWLTEADFKRFRKMVFDVTHIDDDEDDLSDIADQNDMDTPSGRTLIDAIFLFYQRHRRSPGIKIEVRFQRGEQY